MIKKIAIVEDEPDILELVKLHLEKNNYQVHGFSNAADFFSFLTETRPDLAILDLMLPDENGLEICKKLRSNSELSDIAIIILTAKNEEFDRVIGLELGADDYVTKPFSVRELVARVKAVLRRNKPVDTNSVIHINEEFRIDIQKYTVFINDKQVHLTTTEFKILKILASHKGWVFSREQLLQELWGNDKIVLSRTVDVHIRNLREKLGRQGELISNIRGIGYKIL